MNIIKHLFVGALVVGLTACSSDENGGTPSPDLNPAGGIYSTISFRVPASRSTASEGEEAGKNEENNVGSILIVLATKPADDFKFLTFALNDAPLSGVAESTHTIVFRDRDALYEQAGNTVYVFAYCNPSPELRQLVAGTLDTTTGQYSGGLNPGDDFVDLVLNVNAANTWSSNGFLMTSVDVYEKTLPEKAELDTYNTENNPYPLGTVSVIRTACRFDYRDGSPETTPALTFEINEATGEKKKVADVTLTRVALFNLANEFYYLPRNIEGDVTTLCPGKAGMETGYIVSPDERTYSNVLPERLDPLTPSTLAGLDWASLSSILASTEDNEGSWSDNVTPNDKYYIWRYATENTFLAGNEASTDATGYVFEAEIVPVEGFGNVNADGEYQTMYLYSNRLYASAEAIAAEIKNVPVSTLATAFEAGFAPTYDAQGNLTGVTPKDDKVLEALGFTAYHPTADNKYYCYYFSYNRHNDNNKLESVGPMEFGTVRNNIYKLSVTNIKRFGSFTPPTDIEEFDNYFTLDVRVLDWVVRVNNIEY